MATKKNNLLSSHSRMLFLLFWQSLFACALVAGRFLFTANETYIFIIWNLILAWVPVLPAWVAYRYFSTQTPLYYQAPIFLLWLIFLPNAPYIITDFMHLTQWYGVPFWYDILLTTNFVWVGLQLFFYALKLMEIFWQRAHKTTSTLPFILVVITICSAGVYVGRYLRWNSWDIVAHPVIFAGSITNTVLDLTSLAYVLLYTLILSALLYIGYSQTERGLPSK